MKCDWNDCFTCPYPDCVKDSRLMLDKIKDPAPQRIDKPKQNTVDRKAYNKAWNEAHKEWKREYARRYYKKNKARIEKKKKEHYQEHREEILAKAKVYRQRKKIMESKCFECNREFQPASTVLKYKGKYFCSDSCLGEYLVDHAEGIKEIEYDTPENIRLCALEKKGEY